MPRKKLHTEDGPDVFDEAIAAQNAAKGQEVVQQVATAAAMPDERPVTGHIANPSSTPREPANGYAEVETLPRKKWTPPADPFGFENIKGEGNRVRLAKSENKSAWVIRFDKNPNEMEGYSKENPHPVLKMLKDEGYRWGFDKDDKGGWGKAFSGDAYGADHIEARRVLQKAAEMVGAKIEQGQRVSA
jgi:hypothetical protein